MPASECRTSPENPGSPPDSPAPNPLIPWERRNEIGGWKAYWRTVWFILRRNGRIDDALAAPVDYEQARRFRWRTVWYVLVPLAVTLFGGLLIVAAYAWAVGSDQIFPDGNSVLLLLGLATSLIVFLLIAAGHLAGLTGVLRLFFGPGISHKNVRNRAAGLGYYAGAPLVLLAVFPLVILVQLGIHQRDLLDLRVSEMVQEVLVTRNVPLWVVLAYWYQLAVRAVYFVGGRSIARAAFAAVALPVLWGALTVMVWLLPFAIAMWALMYASLA